MFITFEGNEGSGKSTALKGLCKWLTERGYHVVTTREPGGVEIAEQIRSVILDKKNIKMDARTEALLYAAARRQHLVEVILPALAEKKIVICDRFIDSSLAYQGYARKLGMEEVMEINKFAIESTMPSLTIFFDIDPKLGLQRIEENKTREINRLDVESMKFHKDVYEGYKHLCWKFPNRIKTVDASKSVEDVLNSVVKIVANALLNAAESE